MRRQNTLFPSLPPTAPSHSDDREHNVRLLLPTLFCTVLYTPLNNDNLRLRDSRSEIRSALVVEAGQMSDPNLYNLPD